MRVSRRRFLGGAGALIALPALEIFRARPARSEGEADKLRLLVYFVPNGRNPSTWVPPEAGEAFSFPTALAPLAGLKADITCMAGLYHTSAKLSAGTGDHALGTGSILNCAPYPNGAIHGDISMDQALVKALNPSTRFPSLQWGAGEPMACDFGASCIYTQAISWAGPQAPLSPTINPRVAFDQLFGGNDEGATEEEKARRRQSMGSVLDYALDDANRFSAGLGTADQEKLDEYFTSVRELEKRITTPPVVGCEFGVSPPDGLDYPSRVKAFNDLIVLAFQCDQTRVLSFMIENGLSGRSHPFIGAPGGHHALTHGASADDLNQLIALERWQAEQAAYLANRLKATLDADGVPILDRTAMLVLPDMGAGAVHDHENLAPVIVGKLGGRIRGNQSLKYAAAPLGNMYVSLLRAFGVDAAGFGVDGVDVLPGVLA